MSTGLEHIMGMSMHIVTARSTMPLPSPVQICAEVQEK
jgi:hypothetical protein